MRPSIAILAVVLVALVGIVASGMTDLYLRYPHFDTVLHFSGGFVIAWLTAALFTKDVRAMSVPGAILLIAGITMLVGVAWEWAEFLSNIYFADADSGLRAVAWHYFHGGDLGDTLKDLVADTVGAGVLMALYLPLELRRR